MAISTVILDPKVLNLKESLLARQKYALDLDRDRGTKPISDGFTEFIIRAKHVLVDGDLHDDDGPETT